MDITKRSNFDYSMPIPVDRALRKLGRDIGDARRRRRVRAVVLAERASISRTTLVKIEKGDPGVSMGIYAKVLFALGMVDRLAELADIRHDERGLELEAGQLPKRIRRSKQLSLIHISEPTRPY